METWLKRWIAGDDQMFPIVEMDYHDNDGDDDDDDDDDVDDDDDGDNDDGDDDGDVDDDELQLTFWWYFVLCNILQFNSMCSCFLFKADNGF